MTYEVSINSVCLFSSKLSVKYRQVVRYITKVILLAQCFDFFQVICKDVIRRCGRMVGNNCCFGNQW